MVSIYSDTFHLFRGLGRDNMDCAECPIMTLRQDFERGFQGPRDLADHLHLLVEIRLSCKMKECPGIPHHEAARVLVENIISLHSSTLDGKQE